MRSYGLIGLSTPVSRASKPSRSHCQGVLIVGAISTMFLTPSTEFPPPM